jgi:hypothetical protein
MEAETKKQKVSSKQIAGQVKTIAESAEYISRAVAEMPDCGAKKSFTVTLEALNKKVEKYSRAVVVGEKLTDEEKEVLRKFRESKANGTETEISTLSANVVSETESEPVTERKQKGKKH